MTTNDSHENEGEPEASTISWVWVAIAWTLVAIPLLWGVWITVQKAQPLFR